MSGVPVDPRVQPRPMTSVYRRWRPQTFDEVIGQDRITQTLQNAIRSQRISHAYLFAGHRGTGKTTLARILAKALNCVRGPTPEPDNTCPNCIAVNQGSSLDVIEIDGASHTQVDHIRDLKEKIVLAPAEGRYKVYIIDEVHMLSTSAFNALLKTLEEPPAHAVFVLVTTEPHKIPATVASRCQRFDFRRIPVKDIEGRLRRIVQEDGYKIEDQALRHIARLADGSVRDAESILDQVGGYRDEGITTADVLGILGAPADDAVFALADGVLHRDSLQVLRTASELLDEGKDARQVMRTLLEHFRDLLVVKVAEDAAALLDMTPERLETMRRQAQEAQVSDVLRALKILSEADVETRQHPQPRLLLEVALIRMTRPEMDPSVEGLQARLDAIERAGVPVVEGPPKPSSSARPASSPSPAAPRQAPPRPQPSGVRRPSGRGSAEPVQVPAAPSEPPAGETPVADARTVNVRADMDARPVEEPSGTASPTVEEIRSRWARVLEEVKRAKMFCHALLIEGAPVEVAGNTLVVGLRAGYNFHVDTLHRTENRTVVEEALGRVFGRPLRFQCRVMEVEPARAPIASDVTPAGGLGEAPEEDLLVNRAVELFGGEIVEVRRHSENA